MFNPFENLSFPHKFILRVIFNDRRFTYNIYATRTIRRVPSHVLAKLLLCEGIKFASKKDPRIDVYLRTLQYRKLITILDRRHVGAFNRGRTTYIITEGVLG